MFTEAKVHFATIIHEAKLNKQVMAIHNHKTLKTIIPQDSLKLYPPVASCPTANFGAS